MRPAGGNGWGATARGSGSSEPDSRTMLMIRVALALGAVMIPLYGFFYMRWAPGAREFMPERFALSAVLLVALGATWLPAGRRLVWPVFNGLAYLFTFWQLRLTIMNRFSADHLITSMMVFAIVATFFQTRRQLALYCLVSLSGYGGAVLLAPAVETSRFFLLTDLVILLGALWLAGSARIVSGERLRESEEIRKLLADQSRDALIIIDPIARTALEWNRRAGDLLDLGPDRDRSEVAATCFALTEWREIDVVLVLKGIGTHGTYHREHAYLTHGGRAFWGDLSVTSIRIGRRMVLLARIVDASEWHRTQEALRAEGAVYRHMAEQAGDFIAKVTPSGDLVEISESVERLLGRRPDDLKGTPFRDLVREEDRAALEGWPGSRGGESRYSLGRFRFRNRSGPDRWLECMAWNVKDPENGTLVEAIVVGRDVSGAQTIEAGLGRR